MNRTTLLIALAAAGALAAPAVFAQSFGDRARVVSARPVIERIPVSREECWNDRVRGYEDRRVTRTDTGAPIGPPTAAGAIIGGLVGNQVDRDQGNVRPGERVTEVERVPVDRTVQRCRVVDETREATTGFDVRYEYMGRQFNTRMPRDPGRFVRINVDIRPVDTYDEPPQPGGPRPPSYR